MSRETIDLDQAVPKTPLIGALRYHENPGIMRNLRVMVPMYRFTNSFINQKHYPIYDLQRGCPSRAKNRLIVAVTPNRAYYE